MRMRSLVFIGMVTALLWQSAGAEPGAGKLEPNDFAYGIGIETPSAGSVFKLDLPEDLYRAIKRPDLGDVRVFNAQNEAVPYELQRLKPAEKQLETSQLLVFFPIEGEPADGEGGSSVEFREDASGKVVNVRFSANHAKVAQPGSSFLIDLRKQEQSLSALEFQWRSPDPKRVIHLRIDSSDDLKSWQPLVHDGILAKLAYEGENLDQNVIEVPQIKAKFLKIALEKNQPFKLEGVKGLFTRSEKVESPRTWSSVTMRPWGNKEDSAGKKGGDTYKNEYLLDAKALLPAEAVKLVLPEQNSIYRLELASAASEDGPWVQRFAGTVYRMSFDGKEVATPPAELIGIVSDRYWKLRIDGKEVNPANRLPELQLGWRPHQLVFLAKGTGPFLLAYGSATAQPADFGFASLLQTLKAANDEKPLEPQQASLAGAPKDLGGPTRLEPPVVSKPVPWRKWLVWGALILVIVGVSLMAWRLYRDLSAGQSLDGPSGDRPPDTGEPPKGDEPSGIDAPGDSETPSGSAP